MPEKSNKTTIYDIAQLAGVTAGTVSRVINEKPGVSEEKRKQIKALLKKYNYRPDMGARSLVKQETNVIGIVVRDVRLPQQAASVYAIEQQMSQQGYTCLFLNAGNDNNKKAECIRTLSEHKVMGIILFGGSFQNDVVRKAIETYASDTPVVMINGYLEMPNVYGVLADEKSGVEKCVDFLSDKGKHHLAFVDVEVETISSKAKRDGFNAGLFMKNGGNQRAEDFVFHGVDSIMGGYDITKTLLSSGKNIDGIIFTSDFMAIGGVHALVEAGIRVPDQIAVIGIGNTDYCEVSVPRLTALDLKRTEASIMGANILCDVMHGRAVSRTVMIPSELKIRDTV